MQRYRFSYLHNRAIYNGYNIKWGESVINFPAYFYFSHSFHNKIYFSYSRLREILAILITQFAIMFLLFIIALML